MSKTVFFDIDGTIWDDDMVIPESTLEAVAALKRTSGIYMYRTCQSQCEVREAIKYGF